MSQAATYPFALPDLPPKLNCKPDAFTPSLIRARAELAELKGFMHALPNPILLLSPITLKESVASSEIENINTTMESVLQQQLFPEIERRPADKEVLRYSSAMQFGFEKIAKLPLSNRLIIGIHKQLLGENSTSYRTTQNRIVNSITNEVLYTPPVAADVPRLIANWENYVNNDKDQTDPLIKCAIAHYQFEAIHPFGDGNGRTGRILMVLHLLSEGLLDYPVLYISGYINKTRAEYYKLLRNVSAQKDWCAFIDYMLKGFYLQARDTKQQLMAVMELWRKTKDSVRSDLPKVYSAELVDALFSNPVVTPVRLGGILNVHYTTATRYLKQLEEKKFVRHQAMGKYQLYINDRLLKALRGTE